MGQLAGVVDLTLQAGATWRESIWYKTKSTGAAIPLTGWSARMQLRDAMESAAPAFEMTTDDGRLAIDGQNGRVTVNVAASDTTPLIKQNAKTIYLYGLELYRDVNGTEEVVSLLTGKVTVLPEVVR